MTVSRIQAGRLALLAQGYDVARSDLPRAMCHLLLEAGILQTLRAGGGYRVKAEPERLRNFARLRWGIPNLEEYAREDSTVIPFQELDGLPAGPQPAHRTARGLFLRPLGVRVTLAGRPLEAAPEGSAHFVDEARIDDIEVLPCRVYSVDDPTVFFAFERLRGIPQAPACLVLRQHWGAAWRRWMGGRDVDLLHFGDFDYAACLGFQIDVLPFAPAAGLFLPDNLEQLLVRQGSPHLLGQQVEQRWQCAAHPVEHPDLNRLTRALASTRNALALGDLLAPVQATQGGQRQE